VAYPAVTQASDDIAQGQQALVDCAAFSLPQFVVSIILSSQRAALAPRQIHKVQSGDLQWRRSPRCLDVPQGRWTQARAGVGEESSLAVHFPVSR